MDKKEIAYLVFFGDRFRWVMRLNKPIINGMIYDFWEGFGVLIKNGETPQMIAERYNQPVFSLVDGKYYYPKRKEV
ncbi:MAG: hypothetical protein ACUVQP_08810 [Bacteroidales bacterium]